MNEVALERQPLDRWLATQEDGFPTHAGISYPQRLLSVAEYLRDQVHPHVEKGALLHDDGFLTDHGPKHIDTVIRRAGDLLRHPADSYPQLTAYEIYILLMAIHFHDLGNLYGRPEHEQKLEPIMAKICQLVGHDMVERQAIMKIARAHGGHINGYKDTIVALPIVDPILDCQVRYRALAAVLRLADELAEDSRRTTRLLAELEIIPTESRAFHMYAQALQAVAIDPDNGLIQLRYCLTSEQTVLIRKGAETVYLLDEIYARTVKMHYEREYCTRFTRGIVNIDTIDVKIEVYKDQNSIDPCIDPIGYRLQSCGYPGADNATIDQLIPSQQLKKGVELYEELHGTG